MSLLSRALALSSFSPTKPENCLVTEFLTAQVTDFGTSRFKANDSDSVTMTGVG